MTYNVKSEAIKITLEMSEVEFDIMMDIIGTLDMILDDNGVEDDFTVKELFTLLREKTYRYDDNIVFAVETQIAVPGPHDC